jgi:hypothetical protein
LHSQSCAKHTSFYLFAPALDTHTLGLQKPTPSSKKRNGSYCDAHHGGHSGFENPRKEQPDLTAYTLFEAATVSSAGTLGVFVHKLVGGM